MYIYIYTVHIKWTWSFFIGIWWSVDPFSGSWWSNTRSFAWGCSLLRSGCHVGTCIAGLSVLCLEWVRLVRHCHFQRSKNWKLCWLFEARDIGSCCSWIGCAREPRWLKWPKCPSFGWHEKQRVWYEGGIWMSHCWLMACCATGMQGKWCGGLLVAMWMHPEAVDPTRFGGNVQLSTGFCYTLNMQEVHFWGWLSARALNCFRLLPVLMWRHTLMWNDAMIMSLSCLYFKAKFRPI